MDVDGEPTPPGLPVQQLFREETDKKRAETVPEASTPVNDSGVDMIEDHDQHGTSLRQAAKAANAGITDPYREVKAKTYLTQ